MFDLYTDKMAGKFHAEIKKNWSRLTDNEIRMYNGRRALFFDRMAEKYGLNRDDAQRRLAELEEAFWSRAEKVS